MKIDWRRVGSGIIVILALGGLVLERHGYTMFAQWCYFVVVVLAVVSL